MIKFSSVSCFFIKIFSPKGSGPNPGGSARPGQPVARTEQAPIPWPLFKNQFNIQVVLWTTFQILSWKEQILHMILAKRPRSDTDKSVPISITISLFRHMEQVATLKKTEIPPINVFHILFHQCIVQKYGVKQKPHSRISTQNISTKIFQLLLS